MPKKDLNQLAKFLVDQATGDIPTKPESESVKSGRRGGLKGGKSRMASLTDEQRYELAMKAAAARWDKGTPASGVPKPPLVKKH